MRPLVLIVDADNTLRDTNRVFTDAQYALLAVLEAHGYEFPGDKLQFLRSVDRRLIQASGRFEYDFTTLASALIVAAERGEPDFDLDVLEASTANAVQQKAAAADAVRAFQDVLDGTFPPLLPGVIELFDWLRTTRADRGERLAAIVVSEGERGRLERIAEHYGIQRGVFDRIHILPTKDAEAFREAAREGRRILGHGSADVVSLGDSLKRDVAPANAAGCITIYKPAGFHHDERPSSDDELPDYEVSTVHEAIEIIARLADDEGTP